MLFKWFSNGAFPVDLIAAPFIVSSSISLFFWSYNYKVSEEQVSNSLALSILHYSEQDAYLKTVEIECNIRRKNSFKSRLICDNSKSNFIWKLSSKQKYSKRGLYSTLARR